MIRCGTSVFGWKDGKLWKEFDTDTTPGFYYGSAKTAYISLPFTAGFPAIKTPMSVRLNGDDVPSRTILLAGGGSAVTLAYYNRDGIKTAAVLRDRTGNAAA